MAEKKTGLALLREPFPDNQINKLPKGTKAQNECAPGEKVNCKVCGGWHHPKIVHLDYVGHAALTDRLLDADPLWTWEPLAYRDGLPAFDTTGGLWIKLTVCGHTRIGYGHAAPSTFKEIGSREKEVIGDALRNAAMRFGAALDLWFKGDLHEGKTPPVQEDTQEVPPKPESAKTISQVAWESMDEAQVNVLTDIALNISALLSEDRAQEAINYVRKQGLDADEQAALNSRFDSKQRAALKKASLEMKDELTAQA